MKKNVIVIGVLLLCAASWGCGARAPAQTAPGGPGGQAEVPEVIVAQPIVRTVTDYKDFDGKTDAVNTVQLRAHVTGYLDKHFFENREGYDVKKDEPLFKIDPRVYEAELNRSEALLAQARALLDRTQRDYTRADELLKKHAIAQSDYDLAKGDRDSAAAAVKTAEAVRDSAKLNVDFTLISAPFDGQVSRRLVDPGNLITADVTVLTTIVQRDPMYAYFDVDEGTMLHIRRLILAGKVKSSREAEMPVYLQLKDEHGFPHKGIINFVDNAVDPMQGTLRVRGVFPNPDRLLSPGLYAKVRLPVGLPHQAILISQRAVKTDQDKDSVYVIDQDNKVTYRRVRLGAIEDDGLRVVKERTSAEDREGLTADDWVVVDGLQRITGTGVTVRPKQIPMAVGEAEAPPERK
ncbi:MAG: efflux RND transporter periplasmic adaptor subunit [Thermoguttaceae bacterium]|jgi:RND family efflux transporter MFP subunit